MRRPYTRGTRPAPTIQLVPERKLTARAIRSPQHTFRLKVRPWQIVPAGIAPVLPGDTVKAASFKMRVLSKPLVDKLSGWWLETFLFYVRVGDLDDTQQDDFKDMILAGGALATAAAEASFYHPASKWPAMRYCYNLLVNRYFRNEDSTYDPAQIGDYAAAKISGPGGAFDSVAIAEELDGDTPDDADFWLKQWEAYQGMRNEKVTTATWEEYLGANGIALPPQLIQNPSENRVPELLHFTRDWQFPVQAVEPSTGTPSALVQWSLADRLKRGRFCAEPGWLVQLVLCRPKAYLKNQRGAMTAYLMDSRNAWFSPQMDLDPHARLRMFDGVGTVGGAGSGPVRSATKDYWIDPQDFLARGDQFTNYDLGSTVAGALSGINLVDLPYEDLSDGPGYSAINTVYPDGDDADAMFSGSDKFIEVDGVTSYRIASVAARGDASGKRRGMA